jgi:hypothetical protein
MEILGRIQKDPENPHKEHRKGIEMSKTNEITKVPFYGQEILVFERNGKQYVGMKPIVKSMGLDWDKQQELIKRDPVLSSVTTITGVTGNDGKQYQMICLPLEYLNGWLFKVPASRYKGKKREAIIRYQKECFQVLYDYFHNGAALNSLLGMEKIVELFEQAIEKINQRDEVIQRQQKIIDNVMSDAVYGEVSEITGAPKFVLVRQHYRSYVPPKKKKSKNTVKMFFELFKMGDKRDA